VRALSVSGPVFLLTALVACGKGGSPLEPEDIHGTYALKAVAGEGLPTSGTQLDGYTSVIVSGNLTLNPDYTFRRETTFLKIYPGGAGSTSHVLTTGGTWELYGMRKLTLQRTWGLGSKMYGRASKRRVEVWTIYESKKFVYSR